MVDIAVQLYALRSLDAPVPDLLDMAGAAGFDGVEFAYRVREPPIGDVLAALDRNDLDAASAHVSMVALEDEYAETTAFYERLGVETLVVPWLGPKRFETASAVDAVAERLDDLAGRLAADGFRLAYHNHDHEFATVDGTSDGAGEPSEGAGEPSEAAGEPSEAAGEPSEAAAEIPAMERLLARTGDEVGFEVDVGWALVGGADPAALIERYADRITHVHAADVDVDRGESVALGRGDVDLDAVIASARSANAEWLVYEHDDPEDPLASVGNGAVTLREALR